MGKPSNEEQAWRELASEIGAEFLRDQSSRTMKVVARMKRWSVTLHEGRRAADSSWEHVYRTRIIAAPYVSKDGFSFELYRKGPLSDLWRKIFGTKDIEVACPESDRPFFIKGDDKPKVRALAANSRIPQLMQCQPSISVKVLQAKATPDFAEEIDALYADLGYEPIMDVERLKSLFGLFAEILNELSHMGSASEEEPDADAARARLWELRDM